MLRTFLLPLHVGFDTSPRTPSTSLPSAAQHEDETPPEEIAREANTELMQHSVQRLKLAEDIKTRHEALGEIQKIMSQRSYTKDAFRELDGFLTLMSLLSNIQDRLHTDNVETEDQPFAEVLEGVRLIFLNLAEATKDHLENSEYFWNVIGYESLGSSLHGLASNMKTADQTMGFLFSFALQNFEVSDIFMTLREIGQSDADAVIAGFGSRLSIIRHAGAVRILWEAIPQLTSGNNAMRYAFFKLFEVLSNISHRNQAVLSSLGLVTSVFNRFYESRHDPMVPEKERYILQKLLRRLLDMGATTSDARIIFQKTIRNDGSLDPEILDAVRFGMKSRWLDHFSIESPGALSLSTENMRGFLSTGFTFMMWLWISVMPKSSHSLFTVTIGSKFTMSLKLRPDGNLELWSSNASETTRFNKVKVHKSRWMHIILVHYPTRPLNTTIHLLVDGVLADILNWSHSKPESEFQTGSYIIGDLSREAQMSWCLASAYLISFPLDDDLARFIYYLGPRYIGDFQDRALVKFLTYDASTSLNMFLTALVSKKSPAVPQSLTKTIRDGLHIAQSSIYFSLSPVNIRQSGLTSSVRSRGLLGQVTVQGDVFVVKAESLDLALWKLGGAPIALRVVQAAKTQHELSRSLGVLCDGLKNSWQNSEDMERLRGYEILADILRGKAQLINISGFETLFEFLGLSFRNPEQSTIVNTMAYRAVALDFELWSNTRKEIQQVYLEHFLTLLRTSRYRKFNTRQRLGKMNLIRRILFVLQTDWYQQETLPSLIDILKEITQSYFSKEDVIKPIVSFIASHLCQDPEAGQKSPRSSTFRLDSTSMAEKAEQILGMVVSTLSIPSYHAKFAGALPLTRICLLLLGDKPTPNTVIHILTLIGMSNTFWPSFSRKFDSISGWNVLKSMIPYCWNRDVKEATFNVLFGRTSGTKQAALSPSSTIVVCPNIVPTILSAMFVGLIHVVHNSSRNGKLDVVQLRGLPVTESDAEGFVEEIVNLHASSSSFRQVFESHQVTQTFLDSFKAFVSKIKMLPDVTEWERRTLDKVTHLGLALALDPVIAGSQKREILDTIQSAHKVLNPGTDGLGIDPQLVIDTRTVRQRLASAKFSLQIGDRTTVKTIAQTAEWRNSIRVSERKRFRKTTLDLRETRRQVSSLNDWTHVLVSERGLWPQKETRMWRLDETEGPYRIRSKLEPKNGKMQNSRVDGTEQKTREVQAPELESLSIHQMEVSSWVESYEVSTTETEDKQLTEEIIDDKHRRVRHELEPGDVIDAVWTVARIAGVDSSPGLLIIGRTHLYMLDGLVESEDGEVIAAQDAPKRLFFVPGSFVELDGLQRAQRWSHEQIFSYSDRTCLFRDVAIEVYFKDSRSLLIVFLDKKRRHEFDQRLAGIISRHNPDGFDGTLTPGIFKNPFLSRMGSKDLSGLRVGELAAAQRRWQAREISNFSYISILNQISGRTPSDATQYPIFPWVLKDYTSQTLDLHSPDSYREYGRQLPTRSPSLTVPPFFSLTKPMGALTPARREAAETRYSSLKSVDEEPFHYGTHFSSSMIVCHFLIRMAPFTNMFKTLQGGVWDLPDRLFSDIARSYESASQDVRGDVRELIPEFFTCPEFLENSANLDFGVQQNTGERIHDVKLPPWARQDPLLFVMMNRRALESDYVSQHLHGWIDLIWGYKQRDLESLNVFHPLSYEGSIDLDTITDDLEREATVGIIHNFGQTPRKLFNNPHPERHMHVPSSLPMGILRGIEEDPHLLVQGVRCFKDLGPGTPVCELCLDSSGDRIVPCPEGVLCAPSYPHEQIRWQTEGVDLRIVVDDKVVQVVENAFCTCAAFADPNCFATGSSDFTVRLWRVLRRSSVSANAASRVALSHIMRIHTNEVVCVTASRTWSLVVSGSKDGSAALWDLNRGLYMRSIWHGEGGELNTVNLVVINESTGYIATCSRLKLCLHTINARPIATLDLTTTSSYSSLVPTITALAFYEREYSHLGVLATGGPDGTIMLRTWTADGTPEGEKARWEFLTIRTMKVRAGGKGVMRPPSVTSLKFLGESLVHGEETGKSFFWNLPHV